jgi:cell division protein FtsZ
MITAAKRVLIQVDAGSDLTLDEVYEAASIVAQATGSEDAFIVTGYSVDETLGDRVRVTVALAGP